MTTQPDPSFLNYRDVVRPALFDRNGQRSAQASLDKQRENYERDTAPKTSHGKQKAHDATVLAGYKDQLRAARRNPLGVNPARVLHYLDLIDQLETKMSSDFDQSRFEQSKEYKTALARSQAIQELDPTDTESINFANLALESLRKHKDIKTFERELEPIVELASIREQQRLADANLNILEAKMKFAKEENALMKQEIANHNKIESAKGNNNE
jgi:hypothetical protein